MTDWTSTPEEAEFCEWLRGEMRGRYERAWAADRFQWLCQTMHDIDRLPRHLFTDVLEAFTGEHPPTAKAIAAGVRQALTQKGGEGEVDTRYWSEQQVRAHRMKKGARFFLKDWLPKYQALPESMKRHLSAEVRKDTDVMKLAEIYPQAGRWAAAFMLAEKMTDGTWSEDLITATREETDV